MPPSTEPGTPRAAATTAFLLAGAALALHGAAAAADPVQMLAGRWSNAGQVASADPALARPPAAGHPYDWLDRQDALFTPVIIPSLAGRAVHLVWRSGGPDGPVSRQRIWLFRQDADGRTVMDFYTPRSPESLALPAPGATLALGPDALIGYGPSCSLPVMVTATGFAADIPAGCTITARSGRTMTLSARLRLDSGVLEYSEAGILADGSFAFKVPGGPSYRFQRPE